MKPGTGICAIWEEMRGVTGKKDLVAIILREVSQFSLVDLQTFRGAIERELRHLPPRYRKKLYPKMKEQIFGTHHHLLLMHRNGALARVDGTLNEQFGDFCIMVERACSSCDNVNDQRRELLYFLLAAFNIFVMDLPGHPVGTPFPGGFEVKMQFGEYLCPIRDKEDEVETSICPFCRAKQAFL
ncbi:MAG: DUF2115 domain-containing protein [Methanomicrobiales archaeon]|nr:DUF2115 domain-containing protein [Methanomicrobiales archaeon]